MARHGIVRCGEFHLARAQVQYHFIPNAADPVLVACIGNDKAQRFVDVKNWQEGWFYQTDHCRRYKPPWLQPQMFLFFGGQQLACFPQINFTECMRDDPFSLVRPDGGVSIQFHLDVAFVFGLAHEGGYKVRAPWAYFSFVDAALQHRKSRTTFPLSPFLIQYSLSDLVCVKRLLVFALAKGVQVQCAGC